MRIAAKLTASTAILSALTAICVGAVALPTAMSVRRLQGEIRDGYRKAEEQYSLRMHTKTSLSSLESLKPELRRLADLAVTEGNELHFIRSLETIAAQAGVTQDLALETVNQKDISTWERSIPIRLKATGNYRSVIGYMERLSALPYVIEMQTVSLNSVPQGQPLSGDNGAVQAELRGTIRWLSAKHPIFGLLAGQPEPTGR